MEWFEALILGAFQGITEFLPISSSGHLVLLESFFELPVSDLKTFDVAVHVGTLAAILIYFRKDFWGMIKSLFHLLGGKLTDEYGKLIFYIIIGTVPAVIVGFLFEEEIDLIFRNRVSVGIFMIIVAIVFLLAEFVYQRVKGREMTWYKALIIGSAQATALIPGVSRSGSTISAGLFQGINREKAARFSFLLGAPAIFGAALLTVLKNGENVFAGVDLWNVGIGFISSFFLGFLSIAFLMKFLKNHSLVIFAIYRLALGLWILI